MCVFNITKANSFIIFALELILDSSLKVCFSIICATTA
ncbi:hypothetical protein EUBVEN_02730 [Eubacterium ventriosum ATCC 27560]|uniref:Uncharacterized protein n=1 Tax=Eubacterium ventriosum ATCC 27560 TaxID=411463 RepID=A5ZAI3_9FIRM|nr:hypothetical protein EUBVEN_02730 [Eubacterium ventriosum ATCC 27560]